MKLKRMTRSLSTKMSLIAASTMFLCTMTTVGVFLIGNFRQSVEAEQARLQSVASIFGAVLSKPVAAGDASAARNALRALRDLPSILQTSVHDANGVLLAEMGGGAVLERSVLRSDTVKVTDLFSIETMEIKKRLIDGGTPVGELELTADISWMAQLFWQRLFSAAIFAASAIGAGFLIGQRLVRRATRPLRNLANTLSGIGSTETLSYNFSRESDDEVGVLIDAFNDMMGRIDERDKALRAHSDSLEDTVQRRTVELVAARDEAERANAAKSEFLSMMSHEIRTPMNGMMVMAQMLAAAPLSPRHLRFAEIINRSGQNLLSIINDVLDISKIEAGRLELEANPFSLDQLFADVYGLFNERAREHNVYLGFTIDPSVPDVLIGDATRLNQVITNLVNNALKFTEKGSVILRASARKTSSGTKLSVSVSDTGIGIAKDKLALVFDRFSQADQTITRRFGGTGLGLAISKRLVEAMDGSIAVTSTEGKGSTFTAAVLLQAGKSDAQRREFAGMTVRVSCVSSIEAQLLTEALRSCGAVVIADDASASAKLVLTDRESDTAAEGQTVLFLVPLLSIHETSYRTRGRLELSLPASRDTIAQLAEAATSGDYGAFRNINRAAQVIESHEAFRGLRALAVDDNNVNREVLNEALTSMGMNVDCAMNGEDALRLAASNAYDVIFMDCSMPVMDGFTATRILREREKETGGRTTVVAITALNEAVGEKGWRANGMDGWISKPFTIPSIASRITDLVLNAKARPIANGNNAAEDHLLSTPLLDEPTIAMISRLSTGAATGTARRIRELFAQTARSALAGLSSASADENIDLQSECLQTLASSSRSAGALRLAAAANDLVKKARNGSSVSEVQIDMLQSLFARTDRDMASRLGLGLSLDKKAG